MTSLAEQLREFIDTLNEIGPTDYSKDRTGKVRFKKRGHIVPGTSEGVIGEQLITFADKMMIEIDGMSKLDPQKKKEIEAKLRELVEFAQNEL